MSSQTFLTENPPMILDATCSTLKKWPKFAQIRLDIKREVRPDIQASAAFLPFRHQVFDMIYCDPPHHIDGSPSSQFRQEKRLKIVQRKGIFNRAKRNNMVDFVRFGVWDSKMDWYRFLLGTDKEFYRCIKPNGSIFYKICDGGSGTTRIKDFRLLERLMIVKQKSHESRGWHRAITYYLTMKPKPTNKVNLRERIVD